MATTIRCFNCDLAETVPDEMGKSNIQFHLSTCPGPVVRMQLQYPEVVTVFDCNANRWDGVDLVGPRRYRG